MFLKHDIYHNVVIRCIFEVPFDKSAEVKMAGPVNSTMDVDSFLEQERR